MRIQAACLSYLARSVYSALFCLATPLLLLRLRYKAKTNPAYLNRWQERLGVYSPTPAIPCKIWFHGVSVGEIETLFPLIDLVQQHHSEPILVTTTTPTGSMRVSQVLGQRVQHVYLPYDLPGATQRFIQHFQPKLAVIVETEIWPNLYVACQNSHIPLLIINGRLSEKSVKGYQKLPWLTHPALAAMTQILAQTEVDRARFIAIGADSQKVSTLGNMKFDNLITVEQISQGQQLKAHYFAKRWVWLCASTHEGEEAYCLAAYQALKPVIPELLLLLAPRHPARCQAIQSQIAQQQLNWVTKSSHEVCKPDTDVYVLDTLGELKAHYCASDLAFIGGSLQPIGGHNVLEAAAAECPIIFGPYMHNFQEIADALISQKAALLCPTPNELTETVHLLYQQPEQREQLARHAKTLVQNNQGVVARVYELLKPYLGEPVGF